MDVEHGLARVAVAVEDRPISALRIAMLLASAAARRNIDANERIVARRTRSFNVAMCRLGTISR